MNKFAKSKRRGKAFTLIELLTVIVVLAIIVVITTPIITNTIDKAKKSSVIESAKGYWDSVNQFNTEKQQENYTYELDGIYSVNDFKSVGLTFEGKKPKDGILIIKENVLKYACLMIDDYKIKIDNNNALAEIGICNDNDLPNVVDNTLANKQYLSGAEIKDYGGYNWHVISDDGTNVTLLMDEGEYGNYLLPDDLNLVKDDENKISKMAHCTWNTLNHSSNCTVVQDTSTYEDSNYYYIYSWDKSLINTYLNTTFYNEYKNKIKNQIVPESVCNDQSYDGGILVEHLVTCNNYSDYNLRLLTEYELYNIRYFFSSPSIEGSAYTRGIPKLKDITEVTEFSWFDGNNQWWLLTSDFPNMNNNQTLNRFMRNALSSSKKYEKGENEYSLRPVITIKKISIISKSDDVF